MIVDLPDHDGQTNAIVSHFFAFHEICSRTSLSFIYENDTSSKDT